MRASQSLFEKVQLDAIDDSLKIEAFFREWHELIRCYLNRLPCSGCAGQLEVVAAQDGAVSGEDDGHFDGVFELTDVEGQG